MIGYLHAFFAAAPLAAIAAALALGYLCGKLRIGTFVLGPVAATLLVAILIGQVGVPVSGEVKTLAFALFISSEAIASLPAAKEEIARLSANIGVAYAITYLFGTFTVIFFASSLAPKLLAIDLAAAAREYERELGGGRARLPAGQFEAIRALVTRIHQIGPAAGGRTVGELEAQMDGVVVEFIVRGGQPLRVEAHVKLQVGDRVAVAGRRGAVIQRVDDLLGPETADASGMDLIAEMRDVVEFVTAGTPFGRAMAVGPGVPAERVAALRKAFDEVMKDPAFLAEAAQRRLDIDPRPASYPHALADKLAAASPDLVARVKKAIGLTE